MDATDGCDVPEVVRRRILRSHRETVVGLIDAGSEVAAAWDGETAGSPGAVRYPLGRVIERRGLRERWLAAFLAGADALEVGIRGEPVPATPYLAVTSRGPLCRGTLDDARRLVVRVALFDVERRPRRYRFRDPSLETCLAVELL